MHAKLFVKIFALSVCAAPLAAQEADTQPTPVIVARRCADRVARITRAAVHRGVHRTTQCVMEINQLLEQGEDDAAANVAQVCTNALNESSATNVQRVIGVGEECTQALHDLDAPAALIKGTQRHVMRAVHVLQTVRKRLLLRIREAIGLQDNGDMEP